MLRHLSNDTQLMDIRRAVRVAQQELVEERLCVSDPSLFFYLLRLAQKLFHLAVFRLIAGILSRNVGINTRSRSVGLCPG